MKQQIEEKFSSVSALRNSAGIDRTVIQDVETTLSTVMRLSATRDHKLQQSLQLVINLSPFTTVKRVGQVPRCTQTNPRTRTDRQTDNEPNTRSG